MFNRLQMLLMLLIVTNLPRLLYAAGSMEVQLNTYIEDGLRSNLTLQQEQTTLKSAVESRHEAKAKLFPSLSVQSRYTHADGGRSVTIPVGTWMSTLFPSPNPFIDPDRTAALNDTRVTIVPTRDQETKLQVVQPIFSPALVENYRMNTWLVKAGEAELERAVFALVCDIRCAYYTCLQARELIVVCASAYERSKAQLRRARSLHASGMLTEAGVLAAEAERAKSTTAYDKSRLDSDNAGLALAALLDRADGAALLLTMPDSAEMAEALHPIDTAIILYDSLAQRSRRELQQLRYVRDALIRHLSLEKFTCAPTLAAVFEGGIVGERYEVNDNTLFYTASLLLQWDLFAGGGKMSRVRKAQYAIEQVNDKTAETRRDITLQVTKTVRDCYCAQRMCLDADLVVLAAAKQYTAVTRSFEEGAATSMEMAEVQTALTGAEVARTVARYELFRQHALLRSVTAVDSMYLRIPHLLRGNK